MAHHVLDVTLEPRNYSSPRDATRDQDWEDASIDDDVTPGDSFDFEEWLTETWDLGSQGVAHDIASTGI